MALDSEFFDSISIEVVKKKYYNANKVEAVFQTIREQADALNGTIAELTEGKEVLARENLLLMNDKADLAREKAALAQEITDLKNRVSILDRQKDDISDAIMTAREICNRMIEEAQQKAGEVIARAEAEKREIIREARVRQDYTVQKMLESFARIRELQLSSIETLNAEWQSFLAEMPDEEPPEAELSLPAPAAEEESLPPLFTEEYEEEFSEETEEQEAEETAESEEPEERMPTVDDIPIPDDLAEKVSSIVDQILAMHNAFDLDEEE